MTKRILSVRDLGQILHDARIDLNSVRREGQTAIVEGTLERPDEKNRQLMKRYPFELQIEDVDSLEVEDDTDTGILVLSDVTYDPDTAYLTIESAIPNRLRIHCQSDIVLLIESNIATEVRRWGRWRPARLAE